jgi:hypothetical protein
MKGRREDKEKERRGRMLFFFLSLLTSLRYATSKERERKKKKRGGANRVCQSGDWDPDLHPSLPIPMPGDSCISLHWCMNRISKFRWKALKQEKRTKAATKTVKKTSKKEGRQSEANEMIKRIDGMLPAFSSCFDSFCCLFSSQIGSEQTLCLYKKGFVQASR